MEAEPRRSPGGSHGNHLAIPPLRPRRGWTVLLTALGAVSGIAVYAINLAIGGWNPFELLALPLFAILFTWIVFSFALATRGFLSSLRIRQTLVKLDSETVGPTAVLVPVYNENPDDVFARVHAMVTAVKELDTKQESDRAGNLHFFILSDTTDTEIWLAEELAWSRLNQRLAKGESHRTPSVFYRHRAKNEGRKAGNIADFCERWSEPYDCMIILDADSLLAPTTIFAMIDTMSADPELGILQVPPMPIGRESLFARLQQFSAAAYGQISCRGFDAWAGDQGNYWGHNAILRVKAFRESCDLPVLPGKAPLGGEILSHDFVEASLMVRDGWKVRLANHLSGSYEECPTTLTDYAMRDQRWCQGNMQHSRLVVSEGFHWVSRLHFASGILAYVASPLWLAWTAMAVAGWFAEPATRQVANETWVPGPFALFAVAMCMLVIPKVFGIMALIAQRRTSQFGGAVRLCVSVVMETAISVLLSPLMALLHSRFVINTLRGRKVTWNAQNRCEQGVSLKEAVSDYGLHTLLGILVASVIIAWATPLAVWFIPIVTGLIFAIPISMMLGSKPMGKLLAQMGLLMTPEESSVPRVSEIYLHTLTEYEVDTENAKNQDHLQASRFEQLLRSPGFYMLHDRVIGASEANIAMPQADRDHVLALANQDIRDIAPQWRRSILSDQELLKDLHVIAQRGQCL